MEIINALAQWKEEGCPANWEAQWASGYKDEAARLMKDLLNHLK